MVARPLPGAGLADTFHAERCSSALATFLACRGMQDDMRLLIAGAEGVADRFLPTDLWVVTTPDVVTLCSVGMDALLMAWLCRPDSVPETQSIPTL